MCDEVAVELQHQLSSECRSCQMVVRQFRDPYTCNKVKCISLQVQQQGYTHKEMEELMDDK